MTEKTATPTRRNVITAAGAVGLAAAAGSIVQSKAQAGRPHVVIVGAGLAGLCAAYRLQQQGWTYTIIEAEPSYVGGRVRTMSFGDQHHWEAGAMRIPEKHLLVRKYVKEFELPLRRFVMNNDSAYYFGRGRRERIRDEENLRKGVFQLGGKERDKSSSALWQMTVRRAVDKLAADEQTELRSSNVFTFSALKTLDALSLRGLIERARPSELDGMPLSQEAIEYMLFCYGNLTLQHGASTEFLREELNEVWDHRFDEIVGGTARLPQAFLARLVEKPRMGCEVVGLEQTADRVVARFLRGGAIDHAEGDYLLCTMPCPVLARTTVDPAFSPAKQAAIRDIWYDSATKVALLVRNRFWEKNDGIFGGSSVTDLMTGPIFYPSDNAGDESSGTKPNPDVSEQPAVLLASYTWGQDARRLGAMTRERREAFAIAQVKKVHPQLTDDMVLASKSWVWDKHPWAGGAFAFYMPGQFARIHQHVVAPEGRIYFAGEHCSRSHSWMEGALDSAEQAVAALLARQ